MFPTEHVILLKTDSDKDYKKFVRKNKGNGVDEIYGIDENKKEVLSQIRLRTDSFTYDQAIQYMNSSNIEGVIKIATHDSSDCNTVRFDSGEIIGKLEKTKEGYLKGYAAVTRTGVFKYRNFDGTTRKELRHPDEVLNSDSLETLKMVPVTNNHPYTRFVDSKVAKKFACGTTGETVNTDGEIILVSFMITTDEAIKDVEINGKRGLSCGYSQILKPEKGNYKGEDYTHRQTNIEYNHVAIVDKPRAGKAATINIDSVDIYDVNDAVMVDGYLYNNNNNDNGGNTTMPKILINNIAYEAPQEVINELERNKENLDASNIKVEKLEEENSELKGRNDSYKDEIEKIKADMPKEIEKRVSERIDLVEKAIKVLDAEDVKEINSESDNDIKKKIILKMFPNAKEKINSDSVDENYLNARFDSAYELFTENNSDGSYKKQQQSMYKKKNTIDKDDMTPQDRYQNRLYGNQRGLDK